MFTEITLNMQRGVEWVDGCGSVEVVLAHLHSIHNTLLEYSLDTQ